MSDLFGNHIVGFPTRWLICTKFKLQFNLIIMLPLGSLERECFNPLMMNGFIHRYHLGESTFFFFFFGGGGGGGVVSGVFLF